jgi:acyl-CoA thioesterase-1
VVVGCAKKEITNINSRGKNIICFGDSLTSGEGAGEGEDYPSILAENLSMPVINAGKPGDTTFEALKRLKTDVLDQSPLLVILEFGGNDFLQKISPSETFKNLEEMIRKIQEKGAIVAIAEVRAGVILAGYSKEYRRLAKKYHTILIPDILGGILTNPDLKSDYIHPNAEGYKVMAEKVLKVIQPVIQKNSQLRHKTE